MSALRVDAAVFTGRYKDFIKDQQLISGQYGNPANPATFQSINMDRVRISGFEVKVDYDWGQFAGGNWRTNVAYGYTEGKDSNTNQPLDTISPSNWWSVCAMTPPTSVRLSASHWAGKKAGDAAANAWLSPWPRCWI